MAKRTSQSEIATRTGGVLRSLVDSSEAKLRDSRKRGEVAMTYYKAADYDRMYNTSDDELFFKACVKKVWEAFTILVGYMTPDDPHREIDLRDMRFAPGSLDEARYARKAARLGVVEQYLNWSVKETDYTKHMRRAILDYLARGRGVLWTGIHPRKDVITTMWNSELNFITDPNAMIDEDVMFKGYSELMPRSRAYQKYKNAQAIIRDTKRAGKRFSDASSMTGSSNKMDDSLDCIKLHTIYMMNSITEYRDGGAIRAALEAGGVSAGDINSQLLSPTPLRYVFTDEGVLVDVSEWEVPLWKDGLWPCTEIATFDDNSSMTPISPLDAAMKFTEAINWLTTLTIGKARTTMRLLMATMNQNGQGLDDKNKVRALIGKDMESLHINAVGEQGNINQYIQQFQWQNGWIGDSLTLIRFFEQKFDELSGISQIMRSGDPGSQDRSAEATRLRRETSFNRADDMRQSVMDAHDQIARKESIYLQFLKDGDYIGERFGQQAAMDFGYLGEKEDQDPMKWLKELVEQGADPQIAAEQAQERALRAYTVEDIMYESGYKTVVGDGPRHDRAAKLEAGDRFLNQMAPALMQTGDPMDASIAFSAAADFFNEAGYNVETVQKLRGRSQQLEQMSADMAAQQQMGVAPDAQQGDIPQ
jgi:hypothetical protein